VSDAAPERLTRIACLTPSGTGAIATLAVRGPNAWQLAQKLFRPLSRQIEWPPGQPAAGDFWPGRFAEEGAATTDQVVLALKRLYPEPWIELHCHGGREVIRWITETLVSHGAVACHWRDLDRPIGVKSGQAAAALVEALTPRTAAILLDQCQGALGRAVAAVRTAMDVKDTDRAIHLLEELVRYSHLGRHLITPWHVAILGAPNVGKSSLINAIAGYERSIVNPAPGTTRDVVTILTAIDGWPVQLADTAGIRSDASALEAEGIQRALGTAREADLCLWVLDASRPPVWPPAEIGRWKYLVNKIDLPGGWNLSQAEEALRLSAKTGEGIPDLCRALSQWLVPQPPLPGAAVPFNPDLADGVEQVLGLLRQGDLTAARRGLDEL
jgi:tRNA modification GTPase